MRGPGFPGPFLFSARIPVGKVFFANPLRYNNRMPFARSSKSRKPPEPLDVEGLLAYSARVLTARAQTTSELRQKLTRRAAQRGDVDEVIRRLKENGYLNDRRFAESFANWRKENDGVGKIKVVRDLMARRVAPDLAKKTADAVYSGINETALIEQFLARKFRGRDLPVLLQEEKHLASAFRRLRTAGFSAGSSIQVLKRYAAEAARLEEVSEDELVE
jgi:regulatory protein